MRAALEARMQGAELPTGTPVEDAEDAAAGDAVVPGAGSSMRKRPRRKPEHPHRLDEGGESNDATAAAAVAAAAAAGAVTVPLPRKRARGELSNQGGSGAAWQAVGGGSVSAAAVPPQGIVAAGAAGMGAGSMPPPPPKPPAAAIAPGRAGAVAAPKLPAAAPAPIIAPPPPLLRGVSVGGVMVPTGSATAPAVLAPLPPRPQSTISPGSSALRGAAGSGEVGSSDSRPATVSGAPVTVIGFAASQAYAAGGAHTHSPGGAGKRGGGGDVPAASVAPAVAVAGGTTGGGGRNITSYFTKNVSGGGGAQGGAETGGSAAAAPTAAAVASTPAAAATGGGGTAADKQLLERSRVQLQQERARADAAERALAALREEASRALEDERRARLSDRDEAEAARRSAAANLAKALRIVAGERAAAARRALNDQIMRLGRYVTKRSGPSLYEEWEDGEDALALIATKAQLERRKCELDVARKEMLKRNRKARGGAAAAAGGGGKRGGKGAGTTGGGDDGGDVGGEGGDGDEEDDLGDLFGGGLTGGGGAGQVSAPSTSSVASASSGAAALTAVTTAAAAAASSRSTDAFAELDLTQSEEALRVAQMALRNDASAWKEKRAMLEAARALMGLEVKRQRSERESRFKGSPTLGDSRYLLMELLGKGGFSEVWLAVDLFEVREVAIKIHQLAEHWPEAKKANYVKHALREYEIQQSLSHGNVVRLFQVIEMDPNSFATVLEYCRGTDLERVLKQKPCLPEREARSISMQVLAALRYLSGSGEGEGGAGAGAGAGGGGGSAALTSSRAPPPARRIIHYDLKPANILFDEHGNVKVTDFGLAKILGGDLHSGGTDELSNMELTSQGAGTYWYLPPECFDASGGARISPKVDVWSLGVILYQMLFGGRPFGEGQTQEQIAQQGLIHSLLQPGGGARALTFPTGKDAPKVTPEAKAFIKRCLTPEQKLRPDVLTLCADPWLRMKLPGAK